MTHSLLRYIGAFRNKADGGGFLGQLFSSDSAACAAFARHWDKPGVSVYYCPNPLLADAQTREKDTIAEQGEIWGDVDLRGLVTPREKVLATLMSLPAWLEIRDSGGGGYHVGAKLKEPATSPMASLDALEKSQATKEFERSNEARTRLIELLCADRNVNHHAHLLRWPGTHNSNYDVPGECRVIRSGQQVDITEVETFLDLYPIPLFERVPKEVKERIDSLNGGTARRSFDLEERAAELYYPGNIHTFELLGMASQISTGVEVTYAAEEIHGKVRSYITAHPPRRPWNWDREYYRILRMGYSWVNKHPDLAPMLPNDLYAEHKRILAASGTPWLHWDRTRKAWWVTSKTPLREPPPTAQSTGWQYYGMSVPEPMRWTVKGILIEQGVTILSGQWGTFKTTVVLSLALSIMTGLPFAGRFRVKRPGAVIYFAPEGNGGLDYRLQALAREAGIKDDRLPFARRGNCPPLKDRKSAVLVNALIDEAAAELKRVYNVDVAMIVFDTWAKASGARNKGDDDDSAISAAVIETLDAVSAHSKCVCLAVDHMGKDVERGTRGSSGKEAIEGLLATLGDRSVSSPINNTRLVVRKVKDGRAGFEVPLHPVL
jgi:hypothetical protein